MENYLTAGDLALIENRRNYGYNEGCGCGCGYGYRHRDGMAATGIGLAAGLGGAALLGVLAIGWGVNKASEARSNAAMQANTLLTNNLNQLSALALAERNSREGWQNMHQPTMVQYTNAVSSSGAGANALTAAISNAQSSALAQAEANLLSGALTGQFARCPQEVTLVSKQNCGCPATNCGCGCNG